MYVRVCILAFSVLLDVLIELYGLGYTLLLLSYSQPHAYDMLCILIMTLVFPVLTSTLSIE